MQNFTAVNIYFYGCKIYGRKSRNIVKSISFCKMQFLKLFSIVISNLFGEDVTKKFFTGDGGAK